MHRGGLLQRLPTVYSNNAIEEDAGLSWPPLWWGFITCKSTSSPAALQTTDSLVKPAFTVKDSSEFKTQHKYLNLLSLSYTHTHRAPSGLEWTEYLEWRSSSEVWWSWSIKKQKRLRPLKGKSLFSVNIKKENKGKLIIHRYPAALNH